MGVAVPTLPRPVSHGRGASGGGDGSENLYVYGLDLGLEARVTGWVWRLEELGWSRGARREAAGGREQRATLPVPGVMTPTRSSVPRQMKPARTASPPPLPHPPLRNKADTQKQTLRGYRRPSATLPWGPAPPVGGGGVVQGLSPGNPAPCTWQQCRSGTAREPFSWPPGRQCRSRGDVCSGEPG